MKKDSLPSLAQVEQALGEKADKWAGRCFEIASRVVASNLVKGVAVYGHFTGRIDPKSYFGNRSHMAFCQHGWVLLDVKNDGRVFDPTRWAFENKKPYLHVGPLTQEYDEGGNRWRLVQMGTAPDYCESEKKIKFSATCLPSAAWNHVEKLLGIEYAFSTQEPGSLCESQVYWIANAPFDLLEPHAATIYKALSRKNLGGWVPFDNQSRANRQGK